MKYLLILLLITCSFAGQQENIRWEVIEVESEWFPVHKWAWDQVFVKSLDFPPRSVHYYIVEKGPKGVRYKMKIIVDKEEYNRYYVNHEEDTFLCSCK
jgi:hypothetical protein